MDHKNVKEERVFGEFIFLWLDKPNIGRKIFRVLVFLCVCLLSADFIYDRYGHFDFEETPMFFSVYGFLMFSFIIFGAKALRALVKRDENFYGKRAVDSEPLNKMSEND